MKTLRYMGRAMGLLLRSAMQYRASFLMQTLSQAVMTGGDLLAVAVLLGRFTRLGPWSGPEILFFFGVMQCVFALGQFLGRGVENFSAYVHSGEFDTMLARPRALFVQVICARLDPRRLGGILVGLCALALAAAGQPIAWSWGKALLLLVSCLGSALLLLGLFLIEATVSFFSVKSIEMVNVLTYGGRAACQYPADIYPRPLRLLFTFVAPFALCMHLPVSWVLDKPLWGASYGAALLAPLAGAVFFGVMVRVWYWGVRHYRSTGS